MKKASLKIYEFNYFIKIVIAQNHTDYIITYYLQKFKYILKKYEKKYCFFSEICSAG